MNRIYKYHKKITKISRATAIGACGVYVSNDGNLLVIFYHQQLFPVQKSGIKD